MSKLDILKAIVENPGATYNDLIMKTGLSHQSVAKAVRELEAAGLIKSKTGEDKRRRHYFRDPNQLIILRVDEALGIICEELNKIQEALSPEEEVELKEFLKTYITPIIELDLKNDYLGDIREGFLNIVSGVVAERILLDWLLESAKKAGISKNIFIKKFLEETEKRVTDEIAKQYAKLYLRAAKEVPSSFVEKWKKTPRFAKQPAASFGMIANIHKFIKM